MALLPFSISVPSLPELWSLLRLSFLSRRSWGQHKCSYHLAGAGEEPGGGALLASRARYALHVCFLNCYSILKAQISVPSSRKSSLTSLSSQWLPLLLPSPPGPRCEMLTHLGSSLVFPCLSRGGGRFSGCCLVKTWLEVGSQAPAVCSLGAQNTRV